MSWYPLNVDSNIFKRHSSVRAVRVFWFSRIVFGCYVPPPNNKSAFLGYLPGIQIFLTFHKISIVQTTTILSLYKIHDIKKVTNLTLTLIVMVTAMSFLHLTLGLVFMLNAWSQQTLRYSCVQAWICRGGFKGNAPGAPPKIGKNMIFLLKIVIFHTKYPNNFRAFLRSARFFF